jgi:hypothetical protein
MTPARDPSRVCAVCRLNIDDYPNHARLHDPAREFDAGRVAQVERLNLTLRIELGYAPGSGGTGWWATVPPTLPGIGEHGDEGDRS